IVLFSKGCPSPLLAALCAVAAAAPAQATGLAAGDNPLRAGRMRPPPLQARRGQPPLARAIRQLSPLRAPRCGRLSPLQAGSSPPCPQAPPLRAAAPVGGRPLRAGLGRGSLAVYGGWPWLAAPPPRCLHYENTKRTRRMILRDTISSHAV
ncbi:hypothetical protein BHM03_00059727, partial [Ensete ventricosum]